MIVHEDIAVNRYPEGCGTLFEIPPEEQEIAVAGEYPLAIVAAMDDMHGKVGQEVAGDSSHSPHNAKANAR
ncbi:MAG TPA: hypothetical protein VF386_06115 [Usitatibacter sp.]